MAISLGNKIKLTSQAEKLFIEAGGADPNTSLTQHELSQALANAINLLAEHKSPVLLNLYKHLENTGRAPPLSEYEIDDVSHDEK